MQQVFKLSPNELKLFIHNIIEENNEDNLINYKSSEKLFNYVDYILRVNNNYNTCNKMKVKFYEFKCSSINYLKVIVVFYDIKDEKLASIENDSNDSYHFNYKIVNSWYCQNVQKTSIIEELNLIKKDIINKYF